MNYRFSLFCAVFFAAVPLSGAEERTQSTSAMAAKTKNGDSTQGSAYPLVGVHHTEKVDAPAAQTSTEEKPSWTALHTAAYFGDADKVKTLINTMVAAVNQKDRNGSTPLNLAVNGYWRKKDTDMAAIAKTLIDAKAAVDSVDHRGNTALQRLFLDAPDGEERVLRALKDNRELRMATVQTLVDYGADQHKEFGIRYTKDPKEKVIKTTPCMEMRLLSRLPAGAQELPKSKKDAPESKEDTRE